MKASEKWNRRFPLEETIIIKRGKVWAYKIDDLILGIDDPVNE